MNDKDKIEKILGIEEKVADSIHDGLSKEQINTIDIGAKTIKYIKDNFGKIIIFGFTSVYIIFTVLLIPMATSQKDISQNSKDIEQLQHDVEFLKKQYSQTSVNAEKLRMLMDDSAAKKEIESLRKHLLELEKKK